MLIEKGLITIFLVIAFIVMTIAVRRLLWVNREWKNIEGPDRLEEHWLIVLLLSAAAGITFTLALILFPQPRF